MKETILDIFAGKNNFQRPNGDMSSIRKSSIDSIEILLDHLPGDECINKKYHGGPRRVIHHYSQKNYDLLKAVLPNCAEKFIAGSYGENIFTKNINEEDLFLGDQFKLGSTVVELTIPRTPCSTIDDTYEYKGVLKEIIKNSHYGWFYRVITPGTLQYGDSIELIERPNPDLNLYSLIKQVRNKEEVNTTFLKKAVNLDSLDDSWKKKIQAKLK